MSLFRISSSSILSLVLFIMVFFALASVMNEKVGEKQHKFNILTRSMGINYESYYYWLVKNEKVNYINATDQEFGKRHYFSSNILKRLLPKPDDDDDDDDASNHEYNAVGVSHDDLPVYVDWREKGAVTDVKNQGKCKSCWAFSTIVAVEGLHKIETGQLISLSEQELVDCVKPSVDGCQVGGRVENAVEFIIKNGVVHSGTHYPYGECRRSQKKHNNIKHDSKVVVSIDGYERVPANDEKALQRAVAHQPVIVGIAADSDDFMNYQSGVFIGSCGTDLGHAAVIVGYGTDIENGMDYWIVKNSWGTEWGREWVYPNSA